MSLPPRVPLQSKHIHVVAPAPEAVPYARERRESGAVNGSTAAIILDKVVPPWTPALAPGRTTGQPLPVPLTFSRFLQDGSERA